MGSDSAIKTRTECQRDIWKVEHQQRHVKVLMLSKLPLTETYKGILCYTTTSPPEAPCTFLRMGHLSGFSIRALMQSSQIHSLIGKAWCLADGRIIRVIPDL